MDNRIDSQIEDQIMGLFEGLSLDQASDMVNGEVTPTKKDYAKQFINQLDAQGHLQQINEERDRQVVSNHINNLFEETYGEFMQEVAPQQPEVVEENVREDWITDLADQSSNYMKRTTPLDPVAATYDIKSMQKDLTEHRIAELQNQINSLRMIVSEGTMVSGIGQGGDGQTPGSGEVRILRMDDVGADEITIGEGLVWDGEKFVPSSQYTTNPTTRQIDLVKNPGLPGTPVRDVFDLGPIVNPQNWPETLDHQEEANEIFFMTLKYLYDQSLHFENRTYEIDFTQIGSYGVLYTFYESYNDGAGGSETKSTEFEYVGENGIRVYLDGNTIKISGEGAQAFKNIGLINPEIHTLEYLKQNPVPGEYYIFTKDGDFIHSDDPLIIPEPVEAGDLYLAVTEEDTTGEEYIAANWIFIKNPFAGGVQGIDVSGGLLELNGTAENPVIHLDQNKVVTPGHNSLRALTDTTIREYPDPDPDAPEPPMMIEDGSFLKWNSTLLKWTDYVIKDGELGDRYSLKVIDNPSTGVNTATTVNLSLESFYDQDSSIVDFVGVKGVRITARPELVASTGVVLSPAQIYFEATEPGISVKVPSAVEQFEPNTAYLTLIDKGGYLGEEDLNTDLDTVKLQGAGGITLTTTDTINEKIITISAEDVIGALRFLGVVTAGNPINPDEPLTSENLGRFTSPSSDTIADLRKGDYYVFKFQTIYNGTRVKAGDLLMRTFSSWEVIHKNNTEIYINDLADVNLAGRASSSQDYLYYVYKDPSVANGDGRFVVDILDGGTTSELVLHVRDLRGVSVNGTEPGIEQEELEKRLNFYSPSKLWTVKHVFDFPDRRNFELVLDSLRLESGTDEDPISFAYQYRNTETKTECFAALREASNGFNIRTKIEYGLSEGDVLTWNGDIWVSEAPSGATYRFETTTNSGADGITGAVLTLRNNEIPDASSSVLIRGVGETKVTEFESVIYINSDDVIGTTYEISVESIPNSGGRPGAAQILESSKGEDDIITNFVGTNGIAVIAETGTDTIVIDGSEILKSTNYLGEILAEEVQRYYNPESGAAPIFIGRPTSDAKAGDYYFIANQGDVNTDPNDIEGSALTVYPGDTFIFDKANGWVIISTTAGGVKRVDVEGLIYKSGSNEFPVIGLDSNDVVTPDRHKISSLKDVHVPNNNVDLIANEALLVWSTDTSNWHPRVMDMGGKYRLEPSSAGNNAVNINLYQFGENNPPDADSAVKIEGSGLIKTTQSGPNSIKISLTEIGGGLENLGTIDPNITLPSQVMDLPVWDVLNRSPQGGDFFLFEKSGPWIETGYDKDVVVGGDLYLYTTEGVWQVINRNLYVGLNDLIDVDIDSRTIPGITGAEYFVNADPDLEGGWGRYTADVYDREGGGLMYEVTLNKFDIRTNDTTQDNNVQIIHTNSVPGTTIHVYELLDSIGNVKPNGRYEVRVESKGTQTNTFSFNYTEDRDAASLIEALQASGASVPFRLNYYNVEGLDNGDILVYDNKINTWLPKPAPGGSIIIGEEEPPITKAGDFWYDRLRQILNVSDAQEWKFVAEGLQTVIDKVPPEFPLPGQFWIDRNDFKMYVWYEGVSEDTLESFANWVQVGGSPGGGSGGGEGSEEGSCELDGGLADGTGGSCFDGGNKVTVSTQPPTLESEVGDLWVDSGNSYYLYTWTGIKWVALTTDVNPTPYQNAAPIHYSTEPQPDPTPGDLWFDIGDGDLKIWYSDNNTSQWVAITSNSGSERAEVIDDSINEINYAVQTQSNEVETLKDTITTLSLQLENLQAQVIELINQQ